MSNFPSKRWRKRQHLRSLRGAGRNLPTWGWITDPAHPPRRCDVCGSDARLVHNRAIYGGRGRGDWPWIWLCTNPGCGAYTGTHPHSSVPRGRMADRRTKLYRKLAHTQFDRLWREGPFSRSEAYRWLARRLQIPQRSCHFSKLSIEQCQQVLKILKR